MAAERPALDSSDGDRPRPIIGAKRRKFLLVLHCFTCLLISVFYGALSHSGVMLALNGVKGSANNASAILFVGTLPPAPYLARSEKFIIDHVPGGRSPAEVTSKIKEMCAVVNRSAGICRSGAGAAALESCAAEPVAGGRRVLVHLSAALAKKFGAEKWGKRRGGYWPHVDTDELGFDVTWEEGDSSRFTLAVFEAVCDDDARK